MSDFPGDRECVTHHICDCKQRELDRLREALKTARRRIFQIHGTDLDSRRKEITTDAICEIDTALIENCGCANDCRYASRTGRLPDGVICRDGQ